MCYIFEVHKDQYDMCNCAYENGDKLLSLKSIMSCENIEEGRETQRHVHLHTIHIYKQTNARPQNCNTYRIKET